MKNLTLVIFVALLCLTAFSQEDVNMCSQYDINTSSKKETQECLKQHLITLALRGDISWIIVAGPDINYVTTYTIINRNFFKPFFHSSFKVAVKVEWGTYNNNYYEFACITQPYRDKVNTNFIKMGEKLI
ncbi:hypothetical protein KKH82_08580 [Patescibacteria group bacterium]|nr:hypothetical protein [Patescibacteria group bacterium]